MKRVSLLFITRATQAEHTVDHGHEVKFATVISIVLFCIQLHQFIVYFGEKRSAKLYLHDKSGSDKSAHLMDYRLDDVAVEFDA